MHMTLFSAAFTLILVMDPLGNIPVFISILKSVDQKRRRLIIVREMLIALGVLSAFLFGGQYILSAMQISEAALSIGGGVILFLIAIKLIFPDHSRDDQNQQMGEPFLVPLAIPLVAGPSTMAMVMLLATQAPGKVFDWWLALCIAWLVSSLILLSSDVLSRLLKDRGLIALERLMGMILTTMAVQMLLSGISQYFR